MTCNEELGNDVIAWFNATTGYSQLQQFQHLASAPIGLREKILELIRFETDRSRDRSEGRITAKFNSLVDPEIISALYEASQAGVKIRLNVRGICCLKPGVPGLSENIKVVSIVGRFLEHTRLFHFRHGGDDVVLLSSADMMPRNLDRRIELLVPVLDPDCRRAAIRILQTCMKDTASARGIRADGAYDPPPQPADGFRSQQVFQQQALEAAERHQEAQRRMFVPLEPS